MSHSHRKPTSLRVKLFGPRVRAALARGDGDFWDDTGMAPAESWYSEVCSDSELPEPARPRSPSPVLQIRAALVILASVTEALQRGGQALRPAESAEWLDFTNWMAREGL